MSHYWKFTRYGAQHVGNEPFNPRGDASRRLTQNYGARVPVEIWNKVKTSLERNNYVKYFRWQLEKDPEREGGKEHYQVFIVMGVQMDQATMSRYTNIRKGDGFSVWGATSEDSNKTMAEYCWKDDHVVRDEAGEIKDRGQHGQEPQWRSPPGVRAERPETKGDSSQVKQLMTAISSKPEIPLAIAPDLVSLAGLPTAAMAPYTRMLRDGRALANQCRELTIPSHKDFKVIVFYGDAGTGKSLSADYNARLHFAADGFVELQTAQNSGKLWMCNIGDQRTLIMNDYGYNKNNDLTTLLNLIDPMHASKAWETKGGQTRVKFDRIIITSNSAPTQWFPRAAPESKQALLRRITRSVYFTKDHFNNGFPKWTNWGEPAAPAEPQIYDIVQDRFISGGVAAANILQRAQHIRDGFVFDETEEVEPVIRGIRDRITKQGTLNRHALTLGIMPRVPVQPEPQRDKRRREEDVERQPNRQAMTPLLLPRQAIEQTPSAIGQAPLVRAPSPNSPTLEELRALRTAHFTPPKGGVFNDKLAEEFFRGMSQLSPLTSCSEDDEEEEDE